MERGRVYTFGPNRTEEFVEKELTDYARTEAWLAEIDKMDFGPKEPTEKNPVVETDNQERKLKTEDESSFPMQGTQQWDIDPSGDEPPFPSFPWGQGPQPQQNAPDNVEWDGGDTPPERFNENPFRKKRTTKTKDSLQDDVTVGEAYNEAFAYPEGRHGSVANHEFDEEFYRKAATAKTFETDDEEEGDESMNEDMNNANEERNKLNEDMMKALFMKDSENDGMQGEEDEKEENVEYFHSEEVFGLGPLRGSREEQMRRYLVDDPVEQHTGTPATSQTGSVTMTATERKLFEQFNNKSSDGQPMQVHPGGEQQLSERILVPQQRRLQTAQEIRAQLAFQQIARAAFMAAGKRRKGKGKRTRARVVFI